MNLAPGTRLGAYEIHSLLGAGGMGEVYRARDTRLGREVAVKVLPPAFSTSADRLHRFEQEARAAASLNHPNILAVHDIGTYSMPGSDYPAPFIVSELLEGETLRERLTGGTLPVRKAIELGIQIAMALAAAHEKGIVHRDLKPENIFVTREGRAKVLDFGLAKLTQTDGPLATRTDMPTSPASNETQPGMMLGTVGYMAPEQVRGHAVDHRADIFAFGAIVYEMLSGRRAFKGDTSVDTVSAILKEDPPDLPVIERNIPTSLARIIDRCLEKSPEARFHSTHDLAIALETLTHSSGSAVAVESVAEKRKSRRPWLPWALFATTGLLSITLGAWTYARLNVRTAPQTFRTSLLPPADVRIADQAPSRLLALSPDGQHIAFVGIGADQRRMLWVRALNALSPRQLPGTEDAYAPFWSPDGRSIGFYSGIANGKLKRIDIAGGAPTTLCDYKGSPAGADWNRDGIILFTTTGLGGGAILKVPAAGGTPTILLEPNRTGGETDYWWPYFLPDGRRFLYLALRGGRTEVGVYAASLDSQERKLLLSGGSNAKYANGRILFLRDSTLFAQRFDAQRLELQGEAVPVAEDIQINAPTGAFTVSQTGVLAFSTGPRSGGSQLTWFDAAGRQLGTVGNPGPYGDVRLAPDGKRAAVTLLDPARAGRDVWLVDLARDLMTRFTFEASDEFSPVWSPDGERIVFASVRTGVPDLYEKPSSGAVTEKVLLSDKLPKIPLDWSVDGRYLLYATGSSASADLWVLPFEGDRKPFPYMASRFNEIPGAFAPSGQFMAYVSNESGRAEVYVAPFPKPDGKWQVSTSGGTFPIWRQDGNELYYVSPDGRMMAAAVKAAGGRFEVGAVRPLFEVRPGGPRSSADVAPDGRFFLNLAPRNTELTTITLVVNWDQELDRRAASE